MATTNGGQTWAAQPVPSLVATGNGSGLEAIACTSPSRCFADGVANGGGVILGTTDAGATWSVLWSIQQAPDLYVSGGMPAIACPSSTECFALGDSGAVGYATRVLATTDGGSTWTSLPLPADLPQLDGVDCQSVTRCILVGGADIVETADSGSSWVVQTVGNSVAFSLMSVDCPSSTTCYAAGGNGNQGSTSGGVVFTTTDSGTSWTGQSVPIATVNNLTCTSPAHCYGGGSQGYGGEMISTWNGGGSWFVQALPLTTGAIWGLSCPSANVCLSTEAGGWFSENSLILQGPGVGTSSTATTISVSASSSAAGQDLTYTATVTGVPGTAPPTGTVAFAVGATPLCVATLAAGTGSCISSGAPAGLDDVSGSYSGDNTFFSSSGAASMEVGLSTTAISVSPSNALPGEQVTYSADVTAQVGTGTPTGTVAFTAGTTPLCVATLAAGTGSCTASNAPTGLPFILGSYSGNASFQPSSGSTGLAVGLTSVTEVSVSSPTAPPNQPVTYSADVTAGTGTGTPTGSVDFTAGATTLCVAVLSGGSGSCTASNAPMGTSVVVGAYSGDSNYTGSSGTSALFVQSESLTTVSVDSPTIGIGQDVTYSATVGADVGTALPTGTVAFTVGTTDLCVATLVGGSGSCVAGTAPVGVDLVVGTYSGDSDVLGSYGDAVVTVGPTTTTVSATPSPVSTTQPVTYSASVVADVGSGTPTGTVTFTIGSTDLCVATLVGGAGSCVASFDPVGVNQVSGWYSGDSDDAGSSGTAQLTVGPTATTISMSSQSVAASAPVTYSATVTSAFGVPTGTVTFSVPTQTICTATLVNGQGSCVSADAPVGTADVVTGAYSGDSNDFGSIGSATLAVAPFTSQTVFSSTATFGQNVWFTGIATSAGPVTGTITFSIGAMILCTATLNGQGTWSCLDSEVPLGTYTVTAAYSGDSSVAGSSSSQVFSLTRETAAAVSVDPAPATVDQEEIYSATVTAPEGGTPTGTVSFSIGSTDLCVATLVGGTGSCSSHNAPEGVATVTGAYSGDSDLRGIRGVDGHRRQERHVHHPASTVLPRLRPGGLGRRRLRLRGRLLWVAPGTRIARGRHHRHRGHSHRTWLFPGGGGRWGVQLQCAVRQLTTRHRDPRGRHRGYPAHPQ